MNRGNSDADALPTTTAPAGRASAATNRANATNAAPPPAATSSDRAAPTTGAAAVIARPVPSTRTPASNLANDRTMPAAGAAASTCGATPDAVARANVGMRSLIATSGFARTTGDSDTAAARRTPRCAAATVA
jgi:hypothetical protein